MMHLGSHIKGDIWRSRSAEHRIEFIIEEATNICEWSLQSWHPEEAACHLNSHMTTKHARFAAITQHATFRSTKSLQVKGRARQDSSEDMNEQTTQNKNTLCLCYGCARCCSLLEFRHMWCMRAGCVDVCTAFCLCYKMHLSLLSLSLSVHVANSSDD